MTFWVKQHSVFLSIAAPFTSPDDGMALPSCDAGDFLVAAWAETILSFPECQEFVFPFEVGFHVNIEPFFKVLFSLWIIRIGLLPNFVMSPDFYAACASQLNFSEALFIHKQPEEYPISVVHGFEVFLLCLYNTRLKPPHFSVHLVPVNGVPVLRVVENRTSMGFCFQILGCCHLLVSFGGCSNFSCDERPHGSLLAFARDDVVFGSIPISLITREHSLSPCSFPHNPMGFPYGSLSRDRENY